MQRSKIKVGGDYALASWRDWDKYRSHVRKVQVLDVDPWQNVAGYIANADTEKPDVVPVPHRPARETLEVPKRYRRRVRMPYDRGRGLGSLVLVRQWLPGDDGNTGAWGEPTTAETRHLVATWEDAEARMQAHQDAETARLESARADKSRRRDREGRIHERMLDLNLPYSPILERSRVSGEDVVTITAEALEALLAAAEGNR